MPTEVKLMILRFCPDVRALSSLVHASPAYHALYTVYREEVLTTVTLQTLHQRNVRILKPMHAALVYLKGPDINFYMVEQAVQLCTQQLLQRVPTIKLSTEYCQALLNIQATKRWLLARTPRDRYDEVYYRSRITYPSEFDRLCSIHDRDEESTALSLNKRDSKLFRGIISVKGWPELP